MTLKGVNNNYDHDNEVRRIMESGTSEVPRGYKHYKDPWVEKYGKAVLDNSIKDKDKIGCRNFSKTQHETQSQSYAQSFQKGDSQMAFCEYSVIRDIVLQVLKAQGIPNPSDEVIDNAIKEHLEKGYQKVIKIKEH